MSIMIRLTFAFCGVMVLFASLSFAEVDQGFNLLFTSSPKEFDREKLAVSDEFPRWITGEWIRNGPGQFEMGNRKFTHYFDGFAKLLKLEFDNGTVHFTTKFLQTAVYKDSVTMNDIARYQTVLDVDPPFNMIEKIECLKNGMTNLDVNVGALLDTKNKRHYYALNDMWLMYEFNSSLDEVAQINPPPIKVPMLMDLKFSSAHPVKEFGTNNWITYHSVWNPVGKSQFHVFRVADLMDPQPIAVFETDKMHYAHSFGVTKNYAVFTTNACYFNVLKVLRTVPFKAIECDLVNPSSVFVVNLKSGEVRELETDPIFSVHHINAYELDKNTIIVDTTDAVDFSSFADFVLPNILNATARNSLVQKNRVIRLTIHVDKGTIDVTPIKSAKAGFEFLKQTELPTINENIRHSEYCFFYGVVIGSSPNRYANFTLTKTDTCGGNGDLFWYQKNHYPSEPWFVARPDGRGEDDGVLLSVVLDGEKKQSYIAVIDAKTMKLVSRVDLPTIVPFSFHGKLFD